MKKGFSLSTLFFWLLLIATSMVLNTIRFRHCESAPMVFDSGLEVRSDRVSFGWPCDIQIRSRTSRADVIGKTSAGAEIWNVKYYDGYFSPVAIAINCFFAAVAVSFLAWIVQVSKASFSILFSIRDRN